ncbi:DUF2489 domain-containing protein [Saccharospirillum sp. MSK14-1]|uniref:DUF2489 domain-containing protein n=1 Tax=Saccharospirillum sp. MSK14-1 TaxID=1897632 RepID=UPI001304DB62|nr:DUF2489 domain-containing protein [Saccharospirillum sp. MSK14-1]
MMLAVAAVVIIAVLAVIAWRLQRQVWQQQRHQEAQQAAAQQRDAERTAYVLDSLRILSANVIDENLNLSEATIRCKVLVDALNLTDSERQPYQVLETVFEQVQHFDTHGARKALSREERKRQDAAREAIEREYEPELKACFERLRHIGLATQ